ncbi:Uncharacterised protein [Mycobacterium tuberculosis]|uniref:Uncharacterized protein n=1 Tax=Mycobacterium tuberculosis TaxID=1773 RepID=A0A916PDJ9_MYCTX|nr:Uncharacterised protein [Mycobacterium tuberculosis]
MPAGAVGEQVAVRGVADERGQVVADRHNTAFTTFAVNEEKPAVHQVAGVRLGGFGASQPGLTG